MVSVKGKIKFIGIDNICVNLDMDDIERLHIGDVEVIQKKV